MCRHRCTDSRPCTDAPPAGAVPPRIDQRSRHTRGTRNRLGLRLRKRQVRPPRIPRQCRRHPRCTSCRRTLALHRDSRRGSPSVHHSYRWCKGSHHRSRGSALPGRGHRRCRRHPPCTHCHRRRPVPTGQHACKTRSTCRYHRCMDSGRRTDHRSCSR